MMRARIILPGFVSCLSVFIVFAVACLAEGGDSDTSSATSRYSAPSTSGEAGTGTTSTTATQINDNSLKRSASEAAHTAANASEKAYDHVTRDDEDVTLEGRVKAALHENKFTRGSDVHVTADSGTITLTGSVPSASKAERVRQIVASIYGVKTVNNDLHYPKSATSALPPDADSTGIAHPAYSDIAPAENAPAR